MRTFDLFNNRNFNKEWDDFDLPETGFESSHLINLKYGALGALFMSLSSFFTKFIHYDLAIVLPLLVLPFLTWAVAMSLKAQGEKAGTPEMAYIEGMMTGMETSTSSVSLFSLYVAWFFGNNPSQNPFFSPIMLASSVWIAGIALGFIATMLILFLKGSFSVNNK